MPFTCRVAAISCCTCIARSHKSAEGLCHGSCAEGGGVLQSVYLQFVLQHSVKRGDKPMVARQWLRPAWPPFTNARHGSIVILLEPFFALPLPPFWGMPTRGIHRESECQGERLRTRRGRPKDRRMGAAVGLGSEVGTRNTEHGTRRLHGTRNTEHGPLQNYGTRNTKPPEHRPGSNGRRR